MGKIVITKRNNRLLLFLMEDNRPSLIQVSPILQEESLLGSIYLAKVKDIVPGLQAAFLSLSKEKTVFLPLAKNRELLVANRAYETESVLKQGDEVVVQITGEAQKTKPPAASGALTLTGQYLVCSYFGHGIAYSKKLTDEKKEEIREVIHKAEIKNRKKYKFTVRTNAGNLTDFTPMLEEMKHFSDLFETLTISYKHRTCFSCLYHTEPEILRQVKGISLTAYEEIVTDEKEVYEVIKEALPDSPIRFYHDTMLSLSALYSVETHIKQALNKKVWLPCGGYLVIEPTEAMVVIDVNSGKGSAVKNTSGKHLYLKTNLEAAKEIARQLRIRNYSGIIMVDFINMESEKDKNTLLSELDRYLKEDSIYTRLVDMTALGIVEITRKKVSKPLDISLL